jgi:MAP/microtubule affinity-regulating kinase
MDQLVSVVAYLHSQTICHRDIKLENILLTYGVTGTPSDPDTNVKIKLADFGLARKYLPKETLYTRCGSAEYASPQLILSQGYDPEKHDVWAMGCVLYAMVTSSLPFASESNAKLYKQICMGRVVYPSHLSSSCKTLIARLLQVSESSRSTCKEIKSSSWMSQ